MTTDTDTKADLLEQIGTAGAKLTQAKKHLEEVRKVGVDAEQAVVSWRNKLHELKDRLAAIQKAEAEAKEGT